MKRCFVFLVSLFAVIFIAAPVLAKAVDVDIVSDGYGLFPEYTTSSKFCNVYRSYVEAVKGQKYSIRVTNKTSRRMGLVIAVDGRNIISGKKSYLKNNERMYILNPYSTAVYDGWRTSQNQVNKFYFTSDADSYAGAWGDYSAMGVIAVAVFYEKMPVWDTVRQGLNMSAPTAKGKVMSESLGTGFGEEKYSPSIKVEFDPEIAVAEKHFLKYELRETLCNKNIINCRNKKNRFWDDNEDYAPYPPGKTRN